MWATLAVTRERLINPRAEAPLSTRAFRVKGYYAGRKSSADTIIDLLSTDLRYKGSVSNSIRLIHFTGSFSTDLYSRR
jgi:hypothetical protein